MIELINIENRVSFTCEIIGYEFPDTPTDDWCFVRVKIKEGKNLMGIYTQKFVRMLFVCIIALSLACSDTKADDAAKTKKNNVKQ